MTDFVWPSDLVPFQQEFWLQPHTGGSESPFSRQAKVYGLTAPRWICRMSFRGGYDGTTGIDAFGPRLDGALAQLRGRQNRVSIFDFRRSSPRSPQWSRSAGNLAALQGATSLTITGLQPGVKVYVGDYFGGDGRPHVFTSPDFSAIAATANSSGQAAVSFEPPLSAAIGLNAAIFSEVRAMFRRTDDDAANAVAVGELQQIDISFVEDLA